MQELNETAKDALKTEAENGPSLALARLTEQGYHIVQHGAVKPCLWLKRSLRGGDQCYKHHFYGISSHRCVQMTPALHCNHQCLHCWRPIDDVVPMPASWAEPDDLLNGILSEQRRLLSGYGGSNHVDQERLSEARRPAHVALSLIGEPTFYPYLSELLGLIKKSGMTSFLVTNGTLPYALEGLRPTQMYLSLNAPNEYIYKISSRANLWSKIEDSLRILRDSNVRTVIRLTLVKGLNMCDPEGYAKVIELAEPDFVEVKAYMHLGKSRNRLSRDAMPEHEEVRRFADSLGLSLSYDVESEVPLSRVVLLSRGRRDRMIRDI
jgi:tRNA wybutosine-synthesizing protein 1